MSNCEATVVLQIKKMGVWMREAQRGHRERKVRHNPKAIGADLATYSVLTGTTWGEKADCDILFVSNAMMHLRFILFYCISTLLLCPH